MTLAEIAPSSTDPRLGFCCTEYQATTLLIIVVKMLYLVQSPRYQEYLTKSYRKSRVAEAKQPETEAKQPESEAKVEESK